MRKISQFIFSARLTEARIGEPGGLNTRIAAHRGVAGVIATGLVNELLPKTHGYLVITSNDLPDVSAAQRIMQEIAELEGIASVENFLSASIVSLAG